MIIFDTKSKNVVSKCLDIFSVLSILNYVMKIKHKILLRLIKRKNFLCSLFLKIVRSVMFEFPISSNLFGD